MKLDLGKIREIYGDNTLYEFQDNVEELTANMNYLLKLGFENIYDIVECNPYIFITEENLFKKRVNRLITSLGIDYEDRLNNDITLWSIIDDYN